MEIWAVGCLVILLAACATVPETGRRQLSLVPDSMLIPTALSQFDAMQREIGISQNAEYRARVQRIGEEIVIAARMASPEANLPPPEQWRFEVFASDQVNAFAMPGGMVGFFEGIFPLFDNDDQLAVVMGHEVAHVAARHGNERVSQQLGMQVALLGGAIAIGQSEMSAETRMVFLTAMGLGAQFGVLSPFSRRHEFEADYLGLIYMTAAGYDPEESLRFWQKMLDMSGPGQPDWMSTHPSSEARIREMQRQIPGVRARFAPQ